MKTTELVQTFDAQVWADEFMAHMAENQSIAHDRETMVGWFANAIMAGYDHAYFKSREYKRSVRKVLHPWYSWRRYFMPLDNFGRAADTTGQKKEKAMSEPTYPIPEDLNFQYVRAKDIDQDGVNKDRRIEARWTIALIERIARAEYAGKEMLTMNADKSRIIEGHVKRIEELLASHGALEQRVRYLMWASHGHSMRYGDDGEMQCSDCAKYGCWDYKRAPLDEVTKAYDAAILARAALAGAKKLEKGA